MKLVIRNLYLSTCSGKSVLLEDVSDYSLSRTSNILIRNDANTYIMIVGAGVASFGSRRSQFYNGGYQ